LYRNGAGGDFSNSYRVYDGWGALAWGFGLPAS